MPARAAAGQAPGQEPARRAQARPGHRDVLGVRLRGFPGWFVTRTYHLFQLPLVSRKLRVVADWTVSLFFRRDIAELSMLGYPARLELPPEEK